MTNALNLRPVTGAAAGTGLSVKPAWQLNQELQALVVGRTSDRLFTLRIGATEVSARSDLPLSVGSRLTLLVTNLQPEAVLKVIAADNATPHAAGSDPAAAATRLLLPRQTAMPPFFALLKAACPCSGEDLPLLEADTQHLPAFLQVRQLPPHAFHILIERIPGGAH